MLTRYNSTAELTYSRLQTLILPFRHGWDHDIWFLQIWEGS